MKNLSVFLLILVGAVSVTFPEFNQCDAKWANDKIGLSTITICKGGDIITSVAMAMAGLEKNQNPSTLNTWLKANKGYDKNNAFVWNSITPFGMTYEGMIPNSLIKLNLDVGYIVIIEVSKGPHYVLATGYNGNTINVNDPLYTTTKTYDISAVVAGKTAIYKIPVASSDYKPSFAASFLNKIAQKLNTNSLQQE